MYFIGIDTSCYTTSIAIIDENRKIILDERIILKVNKGNRGLRQSEAVFQHNNNISQLIDLMFKTIDPKLIKLVAASSKPRNEKDSYMPVFTVGLNTAKLIGGCLSIPVIETSHQQGHVAAGIFSSKAQFKDKFLVYHISGGTSEMLLAESQLQKLTIIGGTNDLNAGQFIDRVGVALGFDFPCGQQMDNCSERMSTQCLEIPVSVNGCFMSFSGPESYVQRYLQNKLKEEALSTLVSKSVFACIAKSIQTTLLNAVNLYNIKDVLIVGGVASNKYIRSYISDNDKFKENNIKVFFCEPRYSTDNALGTALIGIDEGM